LATAEISSAVPTAVMPPHTTWWSVPSISVMRVENDRAESIMRELPATVHGEEQQWVSAR
jgi:hypothetical protein